MADSPGVLVVGSANMDFVFEAQRIPKVGETLMGRAFHGLPGGKGANQAVAIGKLGGHVAVVGCVGEDAPGQQLAENLARNGVETTFLRSVPSISTGVAGISVDEAGQNSIIVVPGANSEVRASDVDQAIGEFDPRVVLAQLEIPLEVIEALAARKFQAGSHWKFVLNPAPFQPLSDRTLAAVDVITPNEHEAHALTGIFPVDESACKKAADTLLAKGVGAVVLTLGERGVYVASAGDAFFIGAHDVKVVDTTAAGDAFSGALAWFLALGWKLRLAAWHANLVAALSTTRRGAQDSMPSLKAYEQAAALIT